MSMLDNPKKKSKMWTSIAEELKAMGIEVKSLSYCYIFFKSRIEINI